ncbi:Serine/threonine-protein kinase PRP4 [Galdieria sulphuraria]|nr:Serine/threonine-protein kinase PRP4 [Galdieria sulphuraria]
MELEEGEVPKVDNTLSQLFESEWLTNSGINFAVFNGRRPVERKTVVPKMESRKNQVVQETVIPLLSSYKSELSELETERERRRKQWQSILEKRKSCDEGDVESTGLPSIQCVNKSRKTSDHSGQVDNTVVEEESEGESNESKVLGDTRDYESFKEDKEIRERLLRIREDSAKESVEEGHKVLHSSLKKEEGATKFSVDIFSDSPVEDSSKEFLEPRRVVTERVADDAADLEGYCKLLPGDRLDNDRYTVLNIAGKGVFSSVVRALEQTNDTTREKSQFYVNWKRMTDKGSDIVFNSLGTSTLAVIFVCTKEVRRRSSKMIHADLKPDNILVNEEKNMVKICDFGSACFTDECDITPYLVSRFYRAPEIILGLLYGPPVDMWSLGCCLFELYTGKVAFPGRNNNEMLRLFQELKGSFSMKMIRKSPFRHKYFDSAGNFLQGEWDPVSRSEVFKATNIRPKVDLKSRLLRVAETEERKLVPLLADFLDKIFTLDPFKRLSVIEASKHPFVAT